MDIDMSTPCDVLPESWYAASCRPDAFRSVGDAVGPAYRGEEEKLVIPRGHFCEGFLRRQAATAKGDIVTAETSLGFFTFAWGGGAAIRIPGRIFTNYVSLPFARLPTLPQCNWCITGASPSGAHPTVRNTSPLLTPRPVVHSRWMHHSRACSNV